MAVQGARAELSSPMRRTAMVLVLAAALSGSACGEITAFCMTAGAPNGVTLVVTTTPSGLQCHQTVVVDSLPLVPQ